MAEISRLLVTGSRACSYDKYNPLVTFVGYAMPYINSDGTVSDTRSWFRLSLITDFIWGVADAVALFIRTLVDPKATVPKGRYVANSSGNNRPQVPRPSSSGQPGGLGRANIKTLPKNCNSGG